jgi:hypothetical protein
VGTNEMKAIIVAEIEATRPAKSLFWKKIAKLIIDKSQRGKKIEAID